MNRERLIKRIEETYTNVYTKGDVRVYASIWADDITLKETVGIRVLAEGDTSANVEIELMSSNDPVKVMKKVIGAAGLTLKDVEIIGNNIIRDYGNIKRGNRGGKYGVAEIIGELFEMLKERCITRETAEKVDPKMVGSVIIDDGQYRLKAGVLQEMAEELEAEYSVIKKEMQSLGFMYKGTKRDDKGLSLNGEKLRLLSISHADLAEVYDDVEDQEETLGA